MNENTTTATKEESGHNNTTVDNDNDEISLLHNQFTHDLGQLLIKYKPLTKTRYVYGFPTLYVILGCHKDGLDVINNELPGLDKCANFIATRQLVIRESAFCLRELSRNLNTPQKMDDFISTTTAGGGGCVMRSDKIRKSSIPLRELPHQSGGVITHDEFLFFNSSVLPNVDNNEHLLNVFSDLDVD
jgi:hypothetical protein